MKNWIFVWHPKSVLEWNNVNRNLNTVVDFKEFIDQHIPNKDLQEKILSYGKGYADSFDLCIAPNKFDIPKAIRDMSPLVDKTADRLNGQILDTFEEETFKYVIEKNTTKDRSKGHYIIKEHLMPTQLADKTCAKFIDLDVIAKHLEKNLWVALGSFFDMRRDENKDKLNILSSSFLYTRSNEDHMIKNLSGGRHPKPDRYVTCINYLVFKKLKDEDIIVCYFNPNLISAPRRVEMIENERHTVHAFYYSKDIYDFLLKPRVRNGIVVNGNIFTKDDTLKIELHGDSEYKYLYRHTPKIPYKIHTNLDYEVRYNVAHIKVNGPGYFVIEYDIETFTKYNIVRKNAATYRIEYTVFKG
jgi:hypothetical protein